jgi:hypothetical protein
MPSATPLLLSTIIGLLAGLHSSTWGMYKDAPHEGFTWFKFFRSTLIAALVAAPVYAVTAYDPTTAGGALMIFGLVYAVERAIAETYKTFFRQQDQSKYTIPMQLAVLGKPVESRGARYLVGLAYAGIMIGGVYGLVRAQAAWPELGTRTWIVILGSLGGWFSAFGGAWKDAPIEGFQILKFFRSPLMAAGYALILSYVTDNLAAVVIAAEGFVIATTESYKTFFFPSKPRGKFAGKPILFPEMLRKRQFFVPLYVAIWLGLIAGFVAVLLHPVR